VGFAVRDYINRIIKLIVSGAGDASECNNNTINACVTVSGSALGLFLPTEQADFDSHCQ